MFILGCVGKYERGHLEDLNVDDRIISKWIKSK
jgi:hypothetical protein